MAWGVSSFPRFSPFRTGESQRYEGARRTVFPVLVLWGFRFRDQGYRVKGLGYRVYDLRFRISGSGFEV